MVTYHDNSDRFRPAAPTAMANRPVALAPARADVQPLRDYSGVPCETTVDVVVYPFASYGRLAHLRRSLLSLPGVVKAQTLSFMDYRAAFSVTVAPGTTSAHLVLPGTRLVNADGRSVQLTPLAG